MILPTTTQRPDAAAIQRRRTFAIISQTALAEVRLLFGYAVAEPGGQGGGPAAGRGTTTD